MKQSYYDEAVDTLAEFLTEFEEFLNDAADGRWGGETESACDSLADWVPELNTAIRNLRACKPRQ